MAFPAPGLFAALVFAVVASRPATAIQELKAFHCKRLFAGTGVVFAHDSTGLFVPPEQVRLLTQQEAETADSIMLATSDRRSFEQNRHWYYHYDRQYVGCWGNAGQKMVVINLVEQSKAKRFLADYPHALTTYLLVVFTEPGQEFLLTQKVDMQQRTARYY